MQRHARVTVRAQNRTATIHEPAAEGLTRCACSMSLDHLLGKVFVEYLSPLKRDRIKTKMLEEDA